MFQVILINGGYQSPLLQAWGSGGAGVQTPAGAWWVKKERMVPAHKSYLSFLGGLILPRALEKCAFYSSASSELGLEFVCGNK